jgi:hypothetical protein
MADSDTVTVIRQRRQRDRPRHPAAARSGGTLTAPSRCPPALWPSSGLSTQDGLGGQKSWDVVAAAGLFPGGTANYIALEERGDSAR